MATWTCLPLDCSRKDTASRAVGVTYVLSVIIAVGSLAKDWNCVMSVSELWSSITASGSAIDTRIVRIGPPCRDFSACFGSLM